MFVFVDHRDAAIKQAVHLIAEPRLPAPIGTSNTELTHERRRGSGLARSHGSPSVTDFGTEP